MGHLQQKISKKREVTNLTNIASPLKTFIYSIKKLGDENEAMASEFFSKLQTFLELKYSIEAFTTENMNHLKAHYYRHRGGKSKF